MSTILSGASGQRIITLTTDFGLRDPFVGQMKGVILGINPDAVIVDITHSIEPFAVEEAARVIASSFRYFPAGSAHVVIVDPGVGSHRKGLVVDSSGHFFIGPDNGIFTFILRESGSCVFGIENRQYTIDLKSPTFQGRDVFAPVAAHLTRGTKCCDFGHPVTEPVQLAIPESVADGQRVQGEIATIDRFGNAISNITRADLRTDPYTVRLKGKTVSPVMCYADAIGSELSCLINSSGYLEFFCGRGSAARECGITKGDTVTVVFGLRSYDPESNGFYPATTSSEST